jgi:hypothetical protein
LVSQRSVCDALHVDRTAIRYQSRREDDGALRKKIQRLGREEGVTVRRRKCSVNSRAPVPVLALACQRWSLDFVHHQLVAVHGKPGTAIMIAIMGMRSATSALAVVGLMADVTAGEMKVTKGAAVIVA